MYYETTSSDLELEESKKAAERTPVEETHVIALYNELLKDEQEWAFLPPVRISNSSLKDIGLPSLRNFTAI